MATTSINTVRTTNDRSQLRSGLLLATSIGIVIGTIAIATGVAVLLASFTNGLGQFVLLAGGWLAVVSASPAIAGRATTRIADLSVKPRTSTSDRTVHAVVSAIYLR